MGSKSTLDSWWHKKGEDQCHSQGSGHLSAQREPRAGPWLHTQRGRGLDTVFSLIRHLPPVFNHIPNVKGGRERQCSGSTPGNAKCWKATCNKHLNPQSFPFSDKTARLQGHLFSCVETMNIQFFHAERKKIFKRQSWENSSTNFRARLTLGGHQGPYWNTGECSEHQDLEK